MGESTKGKLNNRISIRDIEEVIKQNYTHLETRESSKDFYMISFETGKSRRSLSIYIGQNYSTETEISKWLSLGYNDEAVQIIKVICSYFGGWLDENDCDEQEFYWIDKINNLSDIKQLELENENYIFSKLNTVFSYEEIKKIINNRDLLIQTLQINKF